ncbi:MAG: histidine phosphatase family protein [Mangrovicoccus sp.]
MSRLIYLTHPQVQIDAHIPVPEWDISEIGRQRILSLEDAPWLSNVTSIYSSSEKKAVTSAELIADFCGLPVKTRSDMGENDRSSTGFLPPDEFEKMADAFFANPGIRVKGWESAQEAQTRIVSAVTEILASHQNGDLLCVGHGAVGTLLMSHCAGWEISRSHDQTGGGGNIFVAALPRLTLVHAWRRLEDGPA